MLFKRRPKDGPKKIQPIAHANVQPKQADDLPYHARIVAQLNALEARKRKCNRRDNPNRIKSMVILDHEMSQIMREAIDNGLIPTYSNDKQGWTIFSID